ncbi:MAG: hypothetical protein V4519_03430 [Patescibacteria group bacterium]
MRKPIVRFCPTFVNPNALAAVCRIVNEIGEIVEEGNPNVTPGATYRPFEMATVRPVFIERTNADVSATLNNPANVIGFEVEDPSAAAKRAAEICKVNLIATVILTGREVLGPASRQDVFFLVSPDLGHTLVFGPLEPEKA